jgi:DNA-binding NtrC family response regulator
VHVTDAGGRRTIDDWPGNIRELQNVIQRAVILCDETLVVDASWLEHRPARSTGALRILGRPSVRYPASTGLELGLGFARRESQQAAAPRAEALRPVLPCG